MLMKKFLKILIPCIICSNPVFAGEINVIVTDASNKPVKDAVIYFNPNGGAQISASDRKGPYIMAQKNVQFTPFILAIPRGSIVSFPNQDNFSHHVYSFSPAQKFQLPLYGRDISRSQKFDNAGTVAIGCNIHDKMSAYIKVLDTPYFVQTNERGTARINLPNTSGEIIVWHPLQAAANNEVKQVIDARAPSILNFKIKIRRLVTSGGGY